MCVYCVCVIAERVITDSRTIFDDVMEDFQELGHIKRRFEDWKYDQSESYEEAYIGLCLPKLFTPFVKLRLIEWNPLEVGLNILTLNAHSTYHTYTCCCL